MAAARERRGSTGGQAIAATAYTAAVTAAFAPGTAPAGLLTAPGQRHSSNDDSGHHGGNHSSSSADDSGHHGAGHR